MPATAVWAVPFSHQSRRPLLAPGPVDRCQSISTHWTPPLIATAGEVLQLEASLRAATRSW
jgi:hypothetical protein